MKGHKEREWGYKVRVWGYMAREWGNMGRNDKVMGLDGTGLDLANDEVRELEIQQRILRPRRAKKSANLNNQIFLVYENNTFLNKLQTFFKEIGLTEFLSIVCFLCC